MVDKEDIKRRFRELMGEEAEHFLQGGRRAPTVQQHISFEGDVDTVIINGEPRSKPR